MRDNVFFDTNVLRPAYVYRESQGTAGGFGLMGLSGQFRRVSHHQRPLPLGHFILIFPGGQGGESCAGAALIFPAAASRAGAGAVAGR